VQPVRDVAGAQRGGEDEGVELVDARYELVVNVRERRMEADDAEREPLVEQLVGHHEPVRDPARDRREPRAEPEPEHDR